MAISWVRSLGCASSSSVDDAFCRRVTPISPSQPPCPPRNEKRKVGAAPSLPPPPPPAAPPSRFATLTEVPEGHSSRRVVEIIFASSWSQTGGTAPGKIERLFKVRHPPRAVADFEEYREAVRSRAGKQDPRCAVDGNEMMRFHCSPASGANETMRFHCRSPPGGANATMRFHCCPAGGGNEMVRFHCCSLSGGANDETMRFYCCCPTGGSIDETVSFHCDCPSGGGMRTFAGTGRAHESGGGWGPRRAMAVCRVIAGRVGSSGQESGEFESFSPRNGELRVFDPRAVLPCFLIIYRV